MTHTLEELIPDYIQGLPAYVAGKPVEEVEQELKIHAVKLASNENPLGPSPKAMEAARRALGEANWYPDGGSKRLRAVLAERFGVKAEEVFVGLGSSEIIDLASRALLRPGLEGITSEGAFTLFSIAIRASGGKLILTPQKNFTFDLDTIAGAVTPQTRIIYIANPNNPTGTAFGAAEFLAFLRRVPGDVLIVLDEAYREYASRKDLPDAIKLFREYNNILTLRTFSKVYGLAGLRIGYGIGHPTLVAEMNKLRTPFNVTSVGQAAALAALDDADHVQRSVEINRAERKRLFDGLKKIGLSPVESETNFLFVPIGPFAKALCDELLNEGVIVRPLAWMGFPEAIRISVGSPAENTKLLGALEHAVSLPAEARRGSAHANEFSNRSV
ncbi:MAG TPA: histidinol-phosphate transaminase [Candidatus Acidoferrum sp.]|nr:histidinol-phosphate transaminase [Candidatus Acidoferrum sp.]